MVLVLGALNTIGTDGSIGNEDSEKSVLSVAGKAITPVFYPIGVEKDNWQASVSIFTGLFAKEAVIGTLSGLYAQSDAQSEGKGAEEKEPYSLIGGLKEAFASIPENLSGIWDGFIDPLGLSSSSDISEGEGKSENEAALTGIRKHFPKGVHQAFAFLLFILLYVPCIAATGVVFREVGTFYGTIFVGYLTVLGWSVAAIYHALMVTQNIFWLSTGLGIIAAMFGGFWFYGKKHKVDMI
jgi:ferrous iron transport protein B